MSKRLKVFWCAFTKCCKWIILYVIFLTEMSYRSKAQYSFVWLECGPQQWSLRKQFKWPNHRHIFKSKINDCCRMECETIKMTVKNDNCHDMSANAFGMLFLVFFVCVALPFIMIRLKVYFCEERIQMKIHWYLLELFSSPTSLWAKWLRSSMPNRVRQMANANIHKKSYGLRMNVMECAQLHQICISFS